MLLFGFRNIFKCCKGKGTTELIRRKNLFDQGWNKVQKDIDIANIVLEMRSLRFLISSMLSKR
jgi:hypothetical protein